MYEVHLGCWASVVIIIRVLRELGLRVKGYSYLNYELSVSRLRRLKRVYVLIKLIKYKLSRRRALMINTAQYRGLSMNRSIGI